MASSWEKVNPDNSVDRLPQPYRSINRILENILEAVGEEIGTIEAKRRSEESETALKQAPGTKGLQIHGKVACAHVESRTPPRLALGTLCGEAFLIDTRRQEIISQKQAFGEGEPVTCVALSSDATYSELDKAQGATRAHGKLMVAGTTTPMILVYNIVREKFGTVLAPACSISLPAVSPVEDDVQRPIVEQLYAKGTIGGIWVVALLCNRVVEVYLCPLGAPKRQGEPGAGPMSWQEGMERPILEDNEAEADDDESEDDASGHHRADPGSLEEFASFPKVARATYRFELPSLSLLPGLPEPPLDLITLTAFSVRPDRGSASNRVPLLCFVSSTESNIISALSMPAPAPLAMPAGMDLDTLLAQVPPAPGVLADPATTEVVVPRRRWVLPAKTTAVAVSPNGGIFAAGGEEGALALVNAALGPWLRTMLPGHYAGVAALSFHRADVLISVGRDSWVHHYCMKTDTLLARYMCGPAPSPVPAVDVVATQMLPMAMSLDSEGELRVIDLQRGRKLARGICYGQPQSKEDFEAGLDHPPMPTPDQIPRRLIAVSHGFCVLCQADEGTIGLDGPEDSTELAAQSRDSQDLTLQDVEGADEGGHSWLVFFEHTAVIKKLFPSLAGLSHRSSPKDLFDSIPLQKVAPPRLFKGPSQAHLARHNSSVVFSNVQDGSSAVLAPKPPAMPPTRGGKAGKGGKGNGKGEGSPVAKLTAENLRRLAGGAAFRRSASNRKVGESTLLSDTMERDPRLKSGEAVAPHAVPENWQVAVKRQIKAAVTEKESRLDRMSKRMEQLRKEVSGG